MKKLNDKDREIFKKFLDGPDFENYKAIRGESKSGGSNHSEINFIKRVSLEGQGIKFIKPFNTPDIYTWPGFSLGLKVSGHTDRS